MDVGRERGDARGGKGASERNGDVDSSIHQNDYLNFYLSSPRQRFCLSSTDTLINKTIGPASRLFGCRICGVREKLYESCNHRRLFHSIYIASILMTMV